LIVSGGNSGGSYLHVALRYCCRSKPRGKVVKAEALMIPLGYCTVPEALKTIRLRAVDGTPFGLLDVALADGLLRLFVMRAYENGLQVMRIPLEEIKQLRAAMTGWDWWLPEGRVPKAEERRINPEFAAWLSDFPQGGPRPKEYLEEPIHAPTLRRYSEDQLIIEEAGLDKWCEMWLSPAPAKSGAPGRPSSMGIVVTEFERRRELQQCEQSREAESQALAAWFKQAHPEMQAPTAKTIRNRLPADFQPHNGQRPKL
jgi:hypothetical protein